MKNVFSKSLAILLLLILVLSGTTVFAENVPATPTDLTEETQQDLSAADGGNDLTAAAEIIITRNIRTGEIWEGTVTETKPAILKLNVERAGNVHIVIGSKRAVWATVEKSDRPEEDPEKSYSNPETAELILSRKLEQGSYLITIGPKAPAESAGVTVRFLDDEGFAALEAERETAAGQEQPEENESPEENELPAEDELLPEDGQDEETAEPAEAEFTLPEDRSVHIGLTWDTDNPQIGDVAHFDSVITGYENLSYTLQWQTSWDGAIWTDYPGATAPQLDVTLTEETDGIFFRLVVYVESDQAAE